MRYTVYCFLLLVFLKYNLCYPQNNFNLGVKGSTGITIPSSNTSFDIGSVTYSLRNNIFYSGGVLGQYMLHDLIGIESGILISYQTFRKRDVTKNFIKNYLGWNSLIGVNDYQIPIQMIYKINHPTNPFKHFKITAGASLDWLSTEYLKKSKSSLFVSNILVGLRIGNKKGKWGRIDYGLEYQFSMWGRYKFKITDELVTGNLNTKCSVLSFNLYYYFLNRDL